MGELILCNQNMAAFPYYVEEAAIGVYSLEELSYYICHNVYLLRSDFMNEDLCNWLDRELKLKDAADALREIVRKGGTLSEFVTCLLSQSGYCDRMQIAQIAQQIAELEHKSEYECSKIRDLLRNLGVQGIACGSESRESDSGRECLAQHGKSIYWIISVSGSRGLLPEGVRLQ